MYEQHKQISLFIKSEFKNKDKTALKTFLKVLAECLLKNRKILCENNNQFSKIYL